MGGTHKKTSKLRRRRVIYNWLFGIVMEKVKKDYDELVESYKGSKYKKYINYHARKLLNIICDKPQLKKNGKKKVEDLNKDILLENIIRQEYWFIGISLMYHSKETKKWKEHTKRHQSWENDE